MELLAPAGNFEKFLTAIHFGADAVYMAGGKYGLRAFAGNFDENEMRKAVEIAQKRYWKLCEMCIKIDKKITFGNKL